MIRFNLRAKVLIFTVALVAILLVTSHLVTNTMVAAVLRQQLERRASRSVDNFSEWISARKEKIFTTARNLAESGVLPVAVDWTEPNYLGDVMEHQFRQREEPDLLMVESLKSAWFYQVIDNPLRYGANLPLRAFELPEAQWQAGLSEVVHDGDRLMLTAGAPIRSGVETLGLVTVGMAIDSGVVGDIRFATGCDHVSIVAAGEVLLSTIPPAGRGSLGDALPDGLDPAVSYDLELAGGEGWEGGTYLTRVQPLTSATGETVANVVIQISDAELRGLLASISNALNLTALVAFIVFSFISFFFSGRLTNQLKRLVGHVSALGEGHYEEPIEIEATDEVGHLARSFEDLRLKLRQRTDELVSANTDLDRRVREIGILNQAMVAIASNLPMEDVFALISREAGVLLPVDYSYLALLVEDEEGGSGGAERMRLVAWHAEEGAPGEEPPLEPGASLAEKALTSGELIVRKRLNKKSRFSDEAWLAKGGLRSACVLPLLADEAAIGSLCLAGFEQQAVDEHARRFLRQLATEITIALQRMRLNQELQLIESRLSRLVPSRAMATVDSSRAGISRR